VIPLGYKLIAIIVFCWVITLAASRTPIYEILFGISVMVTIIIGAVFLVDAMRGD